MDPIDNRRAALFWVMQTPRWSAQTARLLDGLAVEIQTVADKSKTFTWEREDAETGEIQTFEIDLSALSSESDEGEVREIILNRKLRLDDYEKPDWIEIIPERKPN